MAASDRQKNVSRKKIACTCDESGDPLNMNDVAIDPLTHNRLLFTSRIDNTVIIGRASKSHRST